MNRKYHARAEDAADENNRENFRAHELDNGHAAAAELENGHNFPLAQA